ncbi:MAG TPA: PqqD family protein [Thermohalobaculum sp.]|nr:PqqD family protein [Thermohalobaculum sp.]
MTQPIHLRAEGLTPVLAVSDGDELLDMLDRVMLGRRMVPVSGPSPDDLIIRIERDSRGWASSVEEGQPAIQYRDAVAAACGIVAALYKQHTLIDRQSLILHAAGVRIGGGLVLITGPYRAGKTVVTTACAAAGLQVFSDDIIPLDPVSLNAVAPGLAIRLRLPLPETLDPATRGFISAHSIAESARYVYVAPPPDRLATGGVQAPIHGVVTLRRIEHAPGDTPPGLERLTPGDALAETIRRNFARETGAGRILDAFDSIVERSPCLALTYSRAEDAAAMLRRAFEGAMPEIPQVATTTPPRRKRSRRILTSGTRLTRTPGVGVRERGEHAFLTDPQEFVIFNLNAVGLGVWRALEQPTSFEALTGLFAAAFPDQAPEDIAADLSAVLRDLAAARLVQVDSG